jgi:hypothetical protein
MTADPKEPEPLCKEWIGAIALRREDFLRKLDVQTDADSVEMWEMRSTAKVFGLDLQTLCVRNCAF